MTPQEPKGEQASADAGVQVAIRMLEHSMVAYGSDHKKGAACMRAINSLVKEFGQNEEKAQEIMPAELKTALMGPGGDAAAAGAAGGGGAPGAGAGAPGGM
jgi:hypothetical protein